MKVLKTAAIIIVSLIGLVAAAVVVFWWGWIRAPSSQAVCSNVVKVFTTEAKRRGKAMPQLGVDRLHKQCIANAGPGKYEGLVPYARRAKCMARADSMEALEQCGDSGDAVARP
ncbi:MAG: hypothetical protein JW751_00430 [Polyangiaceae bacterium]|nr:hypothetical protein [Polyangiaceae bacterium]